MNFNHEVRSLPGTTATIFISDRHGKWSKLSTPAFLFDVSDLLGYCDDIKNIGNREL